MRSPPQRHEGEIRVAHRCFAKVLETVVHVDFMVPGFGPGEVREEVREVEGFVEVVLSGEDGVLVRWGLRGDVRQRSEGEAGGEEVDLRCSVRGDMCSK